MSERVFGPMSSPIHPSSMLLMSTTLGGGMREEAGKVGVRGGKRGERRREREVLDIVMKKGNVV
jgi:hypothetical protein